MLVGSKLLTCDIEANEINNEASFNLFSIKFGNQICQKIPTLKREDSPDFKLGVIYGPSSSGTRHPSFPFFLKIVLFCFEGKAPCFKNFVK
jgi:hypothetical protein